MFISPLEHFVSFLAPLECHICKAEKFMLCFECAPRILSTIDSRCYLCNKLTSQHRVCTSCRSRSHLRRVWWLGAHDTALKPLIYDMKYRRKRAFAREFGKHLGALLPYLPDYSVVMPVPTASKRVRARSYDQAVLIAQQFAKERQLKFANVLQRTNQVDQIGKKRSERFQQMQGAFKIGSGKALGGASVLLIDDVLTTGATLEAAARLLRKHGVQHVDAAVVARHLPG